LITTLLSFAFVLGVLVFVHELGHFLAAKRVGIRVLKFQLGFNPTIISFRRGDTEYGLGALPLGGYVKMAGENPDDVERDEHGGIIRRSDEFLSKTKWERFQVLVMGPMMNILLALGVTALVLYQGAQVPLYEDQPPVIGVVAKGSPAERAGLRSGDRIVSVADHNVDTWEQFLITVGSRPNRELEIKALRNGTEMSTRVTTEVQTAQSKYEIGDIGVFPDVHPHVPSLVAGDPAERAGLKVNDVVVAVDGEPITFSSQLRDAIAKKPNQDITLGVLRDNAPQTVVVHTTKHGTNGWIGIGIQDAFKSVKPGAVEAVTMSVKKNVEYAGMIFQTVWGLITRETSPKQLMGPIAIAQMSGEAASVNWIALFGLMASLSLNLGLLNLLPIPVLDGGHIFIMALEGVARRDFSMRVKEKMLLAGFVVLMMLMVTVMYNDLTRISWIERLMPWR
jgi:regulator of sigma E protease